MRMDEPQDGIVPFLRERFDAVPYRPGLSDAETALRLLKSGVRNTGQIVEVLQRMAAHLGEPVSVSLLRVNADVVSSAMADAFADEGRSLFGARARDEMRTLVGGVVDKLSEGFSSVTDGLDRVAGEVAGTRNELITTREVLSGILSETHDEIAAMRLEALETREEIINGLDAVVHEVRGWGELLHDDLRGIHDTLKHRRRTEAEELMLAGVDYMKQREPDFGNAIGELRKSVHEYKRNPRARYLLGICYVQMNHAKDAKEAFREAIKTQDDPRVAAEYCRTLARLHIALGEYPEAVEVLFRGATLSPFDHETRFQYAVALAIVGDLEGAALEVQGTMLADTLYEARAGLVPELTTIYRDRLKRLHQPIAEGSEPPTYEACLQYGVMAIQLGDYVLASAYLVRHLWRYAVEDHVRHFEQLLSLPSHPAATELLWRVLAHRQLSQHMALSALLGTTATLLETHGVNTARAISAYPLDDLLGPGRERERRPQAFPPYPPYPKILSDVLALPDVVRGEVISRVAGDQAFRNVKLADALDSVSRVQGLGSSYAETAARMLAWHMPSLLRSAPATWTVLAVLARTGCKEQLKTAIVQMLQSNDWLRMEYWRDGASICWSTGLSEYQVQCALQLERRAVEDRVTAVRVQDPVLAAAVTARLLDTIGVEKLLDAIPPANEAWADAAFRCALFQSVPAEASINRFLCLYPRLPEEIAGCAVADFGGAPPLDDTTTLSSTTINRITELFREPLRHGTLDLLFRWLEPFLVRDVAKAATDGKFEACALRPTVLRAGRSVSHEAIASFIRAGQRASQTMRGPLRSLEFDVEALVVLGDEPSRRAVAATVRTLSFIGVTWSDVARVANVLVAANRAQLASMVIDAAMQTIGASDPPDIHELRKLPRTDATVRLCVDAVKRKGVSSYCLHDCVATLLGSGTIHPFDRAPIQSAIRRRRLKELLHKDLFP